MASVCKTVDLFLCFSVLYGLFSGINGQTFSYGCPTGWKQYDNKCYKFAADKKFYEAADAACFSQGAQLVSVTSYAEHQFISDNLMNDRNDLFWFTSGQYSEGTLLWQGDGVKNDDQTNNYWLNNRAPDSRAERIYRVAYTHTENGYRWTNISASQPSGFICEVSRAQAQTLDILNRDYDYGLGQTDTYAVKRGPVITRQPSDTVFFDGAVGVEIECASLGIPLPEYTWWKGNVLGAVSEVTSKETQRYTLSAGKFTIDDPNQTDDLDNYHCRIENSVGVVLSNQAKVFFGYLGSFPNYKPKDVYATAFKGVKMECEAPSYSPRVTYQWFKNAANNIFVYTGNPNMFVSHGGSLYVSEVQPTDSPKNYFCVVTLIGTDTATLAKANPIARSNLGILLLLSADSTSNNDYGPVLHTHVFPSLTIMGTTIRMECIAYGTHPLTYTWRREDGREFAPGTTISDRNRVLTIKNAPLEADGNYVCSCTRNTGARATKVITLTMEAKPYFPYPIGNKFLDIGMSFDWYCKAVARPGATYTWYKNGKPLNTIDGKVDIKKANVLSFKSVNKERDDGMYQCAATNVHGTTFSTGELRVLSFAPNFNRRPLSSVTLVPLGGNMTIPCSVEAAPTPDVEWLKNGGGLGLQPGDINGRIGMDTSFGLVMTQIQYSDQGRYTCQATNSLGSASNQTVVQVMDGIVWRNRPAHGNVLVNRTAFIYCDASFNTNYDLVYTWKFNGREINYDLQRNYVKATNGLHVTNAQFQNQGYYECEARTTIHFISESAYLQVNGPPSMPAGVYVDDESITPRSARVVWTWSEAMNHGAPITRYDIEAESHYHPDVWDVVATDVPENLAKSEAQAVGKRDDQRAITVDNLIPNTNYRFRVRATNAYGKGKDASKPSSSKKIDATAPVIPPRNVTGGGGSVGTLTIKWDILDRAEHCGDNLAYNVYWKKIGQATDWKVENGNTALALKEGMFVIEVGKDNYYLQYQVKVGARNIIGAGPNSTVQIIYSAENMPMVVPIARDMETYNGTSIIAYWDPVPDNRETIRGKVHGYRVQYFPDFEGETPTDFEPDPVLNEVQSKDIYGQTDHMQLVGLYPNTEYLARVMVFNGAGIGPKGEWRRSETANDLLSDYPIFVKVFQHTDHSIRVTWRGVGVHPGEESIQGYILRVWKLQEDIRTAVDTKVEKTNEAIVSGLQTKTVYVLRVLGYSAAGDGALSEAVYFSVQKTGERSIELSIDPTTSEICVSDNNVRTCGCGHLSGWTLLPSILSILTILYTFWAR